MIQRSACLSAVALALACAQGEVPLPVDFIVEAIVTNPTPHSIEIAMLPREPVELYATWAEAGGESPTSTARILSPARELVVLKFDELEPDREYDYAIWSRRPGENEFRERPGARVRTLRRKTDAVFKFAYAADSHIVGRFIKAQCGFGEGQRRALVNFGSTLENVLDSDVDFIVAGGDNFMIHAPRMQTCSGLESLGAGTARNAREADLRYELALSSALWGRLAARVPFLYVLGNHDGEARFGDAEGSYGHFANTRAVARGARLRHLPDPIAAYGNGAGGASGDLYYAFESGDALFVVLDVMAGPGDYPMQPSDWTLGAEQLRWFERVLGENDRTWTFVFAEHLVGGVVSPEPTTETMSHYPAYGRGGLRSTLDGTPRAPFLGEQAELQTLMRAHGVDVFFHGHDHIAVLGEKQAEDGSGEGIYYALGGQASGDGSGPMWQQQAWFREAFDYDGDGEADYLSGATGSLAPGFYRVTVSGGAQLDVAYVASDATDPVANARVEFQLTLFPDGGVSSRRARFSSAVDR